jgi:hypothetical protein
MPATATDQSLPAARSSGHPDAPVDPNAGGLRHDSA